MSPIVARIPSKTASSWHVLYRAALFETDRNRVGERITEAEIAIRNRVKELFVTPADHIEEDLVLEDALYGLHALRNSIAAQARGARGGAAATAA